MKADWVDNIRYAVHGAWLCIFPIFSVLAGVVLLTRVPQATEVLYTFVDPGPIPGPSPDSYLRNILLFGSCVAWSLCAWYGSRLLLERKFPGDGIRRNTGFVRGWRKWFPRAAAVTGPLLLMVLLPTYAYSLTLNGENLLRLCFLLVAVVVGLFVVKRRAIFARRRRNGAVREAERAYPELAEGDRVALWLALAALVAITVALARGNYGVSRFLGAPTLLFLALGGIALFGSIVFVYLPKSFGGPSLVLLPAAVCLAIAQFQLNQNHVLSNRPETLRPAAADLRPTAAEHFRQWIAQHGPADRIVLVAAEGGAARGAWWTGHVLGVADYASQGEFTSKVYAVSGVSGGSVAAASHVALLANRTAEDAGESWAKPSGFPSESACEAVSPRTSLPVQSACFNGRDFLSPVVGYLLFPDFFQRFWPVAEPRWDRSLGLETSWRRDWHGLFNLDTFSQPLASLYVRFQSGQPPSWRTDLPVLLLNSAQAGSGRLAVQSSVKLKAGELDSAADLLTDWDKARNLPLAALVHNSSRFPIVSPAGQIYRDGAAMNDYMDSLVDGGYFENSGAHALLQLLRSVAADYPADEWQALRQRFLVVFVTNEPPAPDEVAADPKDTGSCYIRKRNPAEIRQEELLTPLIGLYSARSARGAAAQAELIRYINQGQDDKRVAGIEIPLDGRQIAEQAPSLTWYMTSQSRQRMWNSLKASDCAGKRLAQAFAEIDPGKAAEWTQRMDHIHAAAQPGPRAP